MTSALADTNLFIRFLTRDSEDMYQRAVKVFADAKDKKIWLVVPYMVIAQVVHVLRSPNLYKLSRTDIVDRLIPLLQLTGVKVEQRVTVLEALDIFATANKDLTDAWLIAKARHGKVKAICSFDAGYKNVPGVKWLEP